MSQPVPSFPPAPGVGAQVFQQSPWRAAGEVIGATAGALLISTGLVYFVVYSLAKLHNTVLCVSLVVVITVAVAAVRVFGPNRRGVRVEVRPDVVLVSRHRNESLSFRRDTTNFAFHRVHRGSRTQGRSLILSLSTAIGQTEIDCSRFGDSVFTCLENTLSAAEGARPLI